MMKFMRRSKDLAITGANARWYDRNTKQYRLEEMKRYAEEVASFLKDGADVLEIAPGPGFLSIFLAGLGNYHVNGVELSHDFVEIATRNAKVAGVDVTFVQGNAAGLPYGDNSFDGIVCTAAFKNFKDPLKAVHEIHRVLRPGGTALIVDMSPHITTQAIDDYIRNVMHMKGTQALFLKLTFKYFLRKGAYTRESFGLLLGNTPFAHSYTIREKDICLYVYLHK